MQPKDDLRVGGVVVRADARHFVLQDAHRPGFFLTLDDTDVAELIGFLYEHSQPAKETIRLVSGSNAAQK